jgi:CDP-glucose 4,6-dehydratase
MVNLFNKIYRGKRVLITGHTGFKGSWLALWLQELGAEVAGYSLSPNTSPSHYNLLNLNLKSVIGNIQDLSQLEKLVAEFQPEIIFHLAAQPLVLESYKDPIGTFQTNTLGIINVFEAARKTKSVRSIINVTSDKCYENKEWEWGYRETDAVGGYDPYSASKGCSEIITSSYRNSFFNALDFEKSHNVLIASTRAGNVIGGGDWALYRLIPDIVKACSKDETVIVRNPNTFRPWQHVLDSLSGYLMLGLKLLESKVEFSGAWNFGPSNDSFISVLDLLKMMKKSWGDIRYTVNNLNESAHEATFLRLDCSKAKMRLEWHPVWDTNKTIAQTALWYKEFYNNKNITSLQQLQQYCEDAIDASNTWTNSK